MYNKQLHHYVPQQLHHNSYTTMYNKQLHHYVPQQLHHNSYTTMYNKSQWSQMSIRFIIFPHIF